MSANFTPFFYDQFLGTFIRYAANEFYLKVCFIWKYVIIQDLRSKLTTQKVIKVLFLLWKFAVV